MYTRYSLAFILVILVTPLPNSSTSTAPAQGINEAGAVVGYVRDAVTHEAILSARVELTSASGQSSVNHFTSTNGEFSVNSRDGNYQLTIQKQGYQIYKTDVSILNGHQVRLDVDLQPDNSPAAPASSETVTAHQLTVPHKARDAYTKGTDLMRKQDYAGAITQYQKAIDEFPTYYEAFAKMGISQYLLGEIPASQTSLQKSIELSDGKFADALFDLSDVLNNIHDYVNAETQAQKGVAADDASWRGYFELARAQVGLKTYPEAEKNAVKSRDMNPKNVQLYVVLTNIHLATRDYASALQDIDAYLKLDPGSPASEQMRGTRAQVSRALSATPAATKPAPSPQSPQ